ncbi:type II secretion system protein GspJ [Escherichia coli]
MMPRPVRGDRASVNRLYWLALACWRLRSEGMRFVRGGVVNPFMRLPRSHMLTVGYRIHHGYLERLTGH